MQEIYCYQFLKGDSITLPKGNLFLSLQAKQWDPKTKKKLFNKKKLVHCWNLEGRGYYFWHRCLHESKKKKYFDEYTVVIGIDIG